MIISLTEGPRRWSATALVVALIAAVTVTIPAASPAHAATEVDSFDPVYNETIWGDYILAGNGTSRCLNASDPDTRDVDGDGNTTEALAPLIGVGANHMSGCATDSNSAASSVQANDSRWLTHMDIDSDSSTFNSTSSQIRIPSDASVRKAILYWGGNSAVADDYLGQIQARYGIAPPYGMCQAAFMYRDYSNYPATTTPTDATTFNRRLIATASSGSTATMKLAVGASGYTDVAATETNLGPNSYSGRIYQSKADVTSWVASQVAAQQTAGTPLTIDLMGANVLTGTGSGCSAGWSLALVYGYDAQDLLNAPGLRNVQILDGFVEVDASSAPYTTTLDIVIDPLATGDPRFGVITYEGDQPIQGDYLEIENTRIREPKVDGGNQTDNFFASTVDPYINGGTNPDNPLVLSRNPSFVNTDGYDSKVQELAAGVAPPGTTSLDVEFGTNGDRYTTGMFIFSFPLGPRIGASKAASSGPTTNGDGSYDVTYSYVVENYGGTVMHDLQLDEDLSGLGKLEASSAAVDAPREFSVNNVTITSNVADAIVLNSGFNGSSDVGVLDGDSGSLNIDESVTLDIEVTFYPAFRNGSFTYENQVQASGDDPTNNDGTPDHITTDLSDSGTDPDPNDNRQPDEDGENDPTPITLARPALTIDKTSNAPSTGLLPGELFTYTVVVNNTDGLAQSAFSVDDVLPAGVGYVAGTTTVVAYDNADTFADNFETSGYSGSSGSIPWTSSWTEINDDNSPSSGGVGVVSDSGDQSLEITDSVQGASRQVDLAGYDQSQLSFGVRRSGLDEFDQFVSVEVSPDGGSSWIELDRFAGEADDGAYATAGYDLTPYQASNTQIRFISSSAMDGTSSVLIDDVTVSVFDGTLDSYSNAIAAPNPLASGIPPTLVTPADPFLVPPGGTMTITFDVRVDDPIGAGLPTLTNIAQVTNTYQVTPASDDESDDVIQADLRLAKTVSDAAPHIGDTVTFTVEVTNDGPETALGVEVEDVLPVGYTYVANSITGGDSNSDTAAPSFTWDFTSLVSGQTETMTLQGVVRPPSGAVDEYRNVAQVTDTDKGDVDSSPNNDDGDQSEDDEDFATPVPQVSDLSLAKTSSNANPNVGERITFTVSLTNDGPTTATNIGVLDVLPSGYTYVANSIAGGTSTDDGSLPNLGWTVSSLASGASEDLTFDVTVGAPSTDSDQYLNTAQVTASDQYDPDSTPNNDDGDQSEDDETTASVSPQIVDLSLAKTVNDAIPNVGDAVQFTVNVANGGLDEATGVSVQDVVPDGYSSITNISNGGSLSGSTITWSGISVAASGSVSLTFDAVVDVPTGAADEYANVAQVTASDQYDPDSTPNNDDGDQSEDDEDDASVDPQVADLSIIKSVSDPFPAVGDTVLFTVVVNNAGPDAATNVSVADIVPPGFGNITSISDSGSLSGSTIMWTGIAIPSGSFEGLTFSADVLTPTSVADEYKNVAEVTASDQHDPDSAPSNDDGDQSEDDEDDATVYPQQADLSLVKTVDVATPNVGDTVTFTVLVSNVGPDDATGVSVEDVVPGGYSGVTNISSGGSILGSTITWSGLTVASTGTVTLTFDATVDAPTGTSGEYFNVAQVTASDQYDPDSAPNNDDGDQSEDDEDDATVTPQVSDLSLAKTVDVATPNVGDTVTFTIQVTNVGPAAATNVSVEDVVPGGYSGVTNISSGGSILGSTITWSGLTVASTGTVTLTFDATVDAPTGTSGEYFNVAQVTASDQYDPDSAPNNDDGDQSEDDEDDATVTPQVSDLSLAKTVDVATPNVGDTVTFTIQVTNVGPAAATNVSVEDVVPGGYSGVTNISSGGSILGSTITWSGLTVASTGTVTLTFDATVDAPTGTSGEYFNVAQVTASDQYDPDSAPNNDDGDQSEDDEDDATVTPQVSDLSLAKTVDVATPNVGDTVTFTIQVTNVGPAAATNVSVEDVVPGGYSGVTNISSGGSILGSTITWSGLTVASTGTVTLTFDATVDAPTGTSGEYFNVAQVTASDQYDPDSAPNNDDGDQSEDDEDDATVTPQVSDLSLAKTVDVATPNVGDTVTFTIQVTNVGPAAATNVSVEDVVPGGYSGVTNISSGGSILGSTITWSGLTVASTGTVTLTFDATVDAPTGTSGEYFNVAQVTASDQYDPDSAPNNGVPSEDDQDAAGVTPQVIDLSVAKSISDTTPNVGDLVTFTVAVANAGPDDATDVSVQDVVPSGYSGITNISHSGSLSGSTITWTGLSINPSATATLTFRAIVDAPTGTAGEYVNVAQVTASDQYDPDSTPNNNVPSEDDQDDATASPQVADLTLAKSVDDATPNVGDVVTFTISVVNNGPSTATTVDVEDVVPSGYSNITSISNGGSLTGSTITWTLPTVGLGFPNRVDLTFDATVDDPTGAIGEYTNVSQVTASDQHDPDSTPDNDVPSEDDQDDAVVTPQVADLTIVKSVDVATPQVGGTVTFTVLVSNLGPDDATNVAVEDVVPSGYSGVTNISHSGSLSGSTITWSALSVLASGSISLTFDATVDAPTGTVGEYDNVAQVTASDQYDPDSTPDNDVPSEDDQDDAGVTPQVSDLFLVKSVSETTPLVGEVVTFTVLVTNEGPATATNVAVEDLLPDGYSGITNISNSGSLSGSTITWTGLTVSASGSVGLTFDATVEAPPASYVNIAEITASDQWDPDSTPDNDDGDQSEDDEDRVGLSPQEADLRLSKTVDNPAAGVGATVTFSVEVFNDGPDDASGVAVGDVVPIGYSGMTNISNGGTLSGSTIAWSGLGISSGASLVLTFDAIVDAPTGVPNEYVNVAQVTASDQFDPDSSPSNDDGDQSEDDEDGAGVNPDEADLSLSKSASDTTPNVGDAVTFTIVVLNSGPDAASGASVEDSIPSGFSGVSNISSGGSLSGSTITWTGLGVAALGSATVTFDAVADAPTGTPGEYDNAAEVTAADQYDPDSTPANDDGDQSEDDEDRASVTPQVSDLLLTKSVSETTPNVGDTVTFTVTVRNAGPDAATAVSIEDLLPGGFTYVGNSMAGGSSTDDSLAPVLTWTISTLGVGAANQEVLTFDAVVDPPTGTAGEYANVAQVAASDQYDPNSTPDNDVPSEDDQDDAVVTPLVADLSLVKSVDETTPNVGDTVSFTLLVGNLGPDAATNVAIEDIVPSGYSGVTSISDSGSLSGSTITWTGLSIAASGSVSLTFDATVNAPTGAIGEYDNAAQVTASDQYDPNSTPDNDVPSEDDQDDASVTPLVADLSLVKSVDEATPNAGDTVTFTIQVGNAGPSNATSVSVEDITPGGYSAISNISGSGVLTGSTISWSGLSIAASDSILLTFDATVDAPTGTPGEYTNVAQVSASDQHDPDSAPDNGVPTEDDQDDASVAPQAADLSLVKSVDDATPQVGDTVAFTIVVSNAGPDAATNVSVEDVVPVGYSAINTISNSGVLTGSTIAWSGLSIAASDSILLTFDATVDAPTGTPGEYTNVAQVIASDQHDPDSAPDNDVPTEDDQDDAAVTPQIADLSVLKSVDDAAPNVGDTVTFTIAVSNAGPNAATNVTIEDVVPVGFSAVTSISDSGVLTGSTIAWTGLSIPASGSISLTFDANVDAPSGTPGEHTNVAQVTASDQHDPDSTPDNDVPSEDDQDVASVTPQRADLRLVKTVSDTTPTVGDTVGFTITVVNTGPDAATAVAVEDVLPGGYTYVSTTITGGDSRSEALAPTLTWTIDTLDVGVANQVVLTFDAVVDAPTGLSGEFTNVAQVTGSDQYDPDSTPDNDVPSEDDQDDAQTTPQVADLSLDKSVSNASPNVGDTVTFTIAVSNGGPSDASGVSVDDVVPAGYSGVTNISSSGTMSGATITWTGLSVPASGTTNVTFDAVVDAPTGLSGEFTNVAQVTGSDQYDPDSTPDNDVPSEDDQDDAQTTPQVADLSLDKSVSNASPNVGDTVTFTIAVSNGGPSDASGVSVDDVVPAGYSGVTNISSSGTMSGATITWTGLSVPASGTTNVTFDAVVDAPTGLSGEFTNVAQVTGSDQYDPDSTPDNDVPSEDDQDDAQTTSAIIGLAKTVNSVTNNGDGTYSVSYLLTAENLGLVTVSNLEIHDDIVTQFAAVSPTGFTAIDGSLTANGSWDGTAGANVVASGQSIDPGQSKTVQIAFTVTPGVDAGPHDNTATVDGTTPTGSVTDDSTDGVDPDPDGNGIPSEDDPTPVSFNEAPGLGAAKELSAAPASNGDGSFNLTFTILVENTGDVDLADIQVREDLVDTFSGADAWNVVSTSSSELTVSPSFDGDADTNLLDGTDSLDVGDSGSVDVVVSVTPGENLGLYWNSVAATGDSPTGTTVGDVSQDGTDVDPDGDGSPTDNNDPTPVTFPGIGSIEGTIWNDTDADGVMDPSEEGIEGVTVNLMGRGADGVLGTTDDVVVATATTDGDGDYEFTEVPVGMYRAVVDTTTLPVGMVETFDLDGTLDDMTDVSVVAGEATSNVDFGYVSGFNIVLTKTVNGDAAIGATLNYVLVLTNEGPAPTTGTLTVTDNVPSALTIEDVDAPGWSCGVVGQSVDCVREGDLAVGSTDFITITTTVGGSVGQNIVNTATVTVDGPIDDLDITDNTDSVETTIGELPHTGADLFGFALFGILFLGTGIVLWVTTRRRDEDEETQAA